MGRKSATTKSVCSPKVFQIVVVNLLPAAFDYAPFDLNSKREWKLNERKAKIFDFMPRKCFEY